MRRKKKNLKIYQRATVVDPKNSDHLYYLSCKWLVTTQQVRMAIHKTQSVDIEVIHQYLLELQAFEAKHNSYLHN